MENLVTIQLDLTPGVYAAIPALQDALSQYGKSGTRPDAQTAIRTALLRCMLQEGVVFTGDDNV